MDMQTIDKEPQLGSFNDFTEETGLAGQEAIEAYSEALYQNRLALAAQLGVSLDDLHDRRINYRAESS